MIKNRLLALVFAPFVLSIVSAHGQLGPKDGKRLNPTDLGRVKVGDVAPDFALENVDGTAITLSGFRGKKDVVLVFYRGHW